MRTSRGSAPSVRALVNHQGRWHLHAWDEAAEGTRTFLLARIVGPVASAGRTAPIEEGDHAATALAQLDEILRRNTALVRVAADSDAALRLGRRAESEGRSSHSAPPLHRSRHPRRRAGRLRSGGARAGAAGAPPEGRRSSAPLPRRSGGALDG
ncbi:WYL domain-containing protein [Rathayibacter oskolensis]|nr:WYL domain-containing protein [Rathayibacter oskolensis]WKK71284.1 WYL domain-containing protein [Rathayibacter oskolensis]